MKTILALVYREMVTLSRKKSFRWTRLSVIALVAFVIFITLLSYVAAPYSPGLSSQAGLAILTSFTVIVGLLVVFLGPVSASTLLAKEKQDKTLGLVLITALSPLDIILGNFFAKVTTLSVTSLSCLPLLIVCVGIGGISLEQILVLYLILVSFIWVSTALGVLAGVWVSPRAAQIVAILLTFLFLTLGGVEKAGLGSPGVSVVLSPILALQSCLEATNYGLCLLNVLFNAFFSFLVLLLAGYLLPWAYVEEENRPSKIRARKKANPIVKEREITGNPIVWKDYSAYGGKSKLRLKVVSCSLLMAICTGASLLAERSFAGAAVSFFILAALVILTMLAKGMYCFAIEREKRTLEFLLSTSLTESEIVWGKIHAIFKSLSPYFPFLLLTGLLSFLEYASSMTPEVLVTVVSMFAYCLMLLGFTIYISLCLPTVRMAVITSIVVLFYCAPLSFQGVIYGMMSQSTLAVGFSVVFAYLFFFWFLVKLSIWNMRYFALDQKPKTAEEKEAEKKRKTKK